MEARDAGGGIDSAQWRTEAHARRGVKRPCNVHMRDVHPAGSTARAPFRRRGGMSMRHWRCIVIGRAERGLLCAVRCYGGHKLMLYGEADCGITGAM